MIEHLVRDNILRLTPYSSARSEFKGTASVFIDANENPFDTGLNRYPDPLQWKLKAQIGAWRRVEAEHIFLGNGSDEAIDLLVRIFCEPGRDHIVIVPPTYGMYQVSADIANVAVRSVPLQNTFQPDVEAILAQSDAHSKLLFLCSPNNPTANDMEPGRLRRLIAGFPGIVVVDEAYIDFSAQSSCIGWLKEFPNLVVLQTFSKAWGLAGIRLGMAFASEEIIALFNKVKPPYNVNELTQRAALEALTDKNRQEEWVRTILWQRTLLTQFLSGLEYVERIYPSDANFLLVKVRDANGLYRYLADLGIIVRNRSSVPGCEGCLRITVGTPQENEKLLEALVGFC
ncbi:MAG: histidinol-phosphate transaminase [Saprospiraceae bacterium]|nr:histidinol-phosphate transaminase [Saprospiraceae bacterium]